MHFCKRTGVVFYLFFQLFYIVFGKFMTPVNGKLCSSFLLCQCTPLSGHKDKHISCTNKIIKKRLVKPFLNVLLFSKGYFSIYFQIINIFKKLKLFYWLTSIFCHIISRLLVYIYTCIIYNYIWRGACVGCPQQCNVAHCVGAMQ